MAILTLIEQQQLKPISPNWANQRVEGLGITNFDQLAQEVEDSDLQTLLGVALLQDVQDNPTEARNVTLLDGGSFEDCNGNTIKFKGLKYILAYMNYSQYVAEGYAADTFSGFVKASRPDSEHLNSTERKEIKSNVRGKAMVQWDIIKQFLNKNSDTYTLWYCAQSKKPYRPRMYGVRKTIRR